MSTATLDRTLQSSNVESFPGEWMIVRVRPKWERNLSRHLTIEGIDHFLPIELVNYRRPDGSIRKDKYERIPWPGYVFVNGQMPDVWWQIADCMERADLGSRNPATYIKPSKYPARLVMALGQFQKNAERGVTRYAERIDIGSRVRVMRGPFINFDGMVVGFDGLRVKVLTMMMGQDAVVPIEAGDLEKE